MLRAILIAIPIVLAVFLIVVSLRPDHFKTTRSIKIAAPPSVIFPHVSDLRLWQEWSPWAKVDPNAKLTFGESTSGVGATYTWEGKKVGAGRMTVAESQPGQLVRFNLDFKKPFAASNIAEFILTPEGDQTVVTWSMTGKHNFLFKAVGLFMDFDKMCGSQFEEGLASLKTIAEAKTSVTSR